jgi:hypothetical protein
MHDGGKLDRLETSIWGSSWLNRLTRKANLKLRKGYSFHHYFFLLPFSQQTGFAQQLTPEIAHIKTNSDFSESREIEKQKMWRTFC